jgi:hypothetical protein
MRPIKTRIEGIYGDVADQVTALRLQALGAVNGLTVYLPPVHTRQGARALLDPEAKSSIELKLC